MEKVTNQKVSWIGRFVSFQLKPLNPLKGAFGRSVQMGSKSPLGDLGVRPVSSAPV